MTQIGTVDLSNGETLCYRKAGSGDKVLMLIHGNMSSSRHWEPVLKGIPEGYTVYAPDLRGFGDSTYNAPIDTLADFAADVLDFAAKLGLEKFSVLGWSTGGGVALELAARHPQLVESVVLVESVSFKGYPIFKKDAQGQPLLGQHYSTKAEMAADPVQVAPAVAALERGDKAFMRFLWDLAIFNVKKPQEEEYAELIDATMKQRNLVDVDWALAAFNMGTGSNGVAEGSGLIEQVTCPVLSFWGDKDMVVLQYMVEETVAAIGENARLVILENCGHSPLADAYETMMAEVRAFLP